MRTIKAPRKNKTIGIFPEPVPEPTREELLAKADERVLQVFNDMNRDAVLKLAEIKELLQRDNVLLSSQISWKADDIVKAEVRMEIFRFFAGLTTNETKPRSPFEAACWIYHDLQERLIGQSSLGGQEIKPNSTSIAHNAMAIYRAEAISYAIRYDLSVVKFYAKKLGVDLFFDAED